MAIHTARHSHDTPRRALTAGLALTLGFAAVEVAAGLFSGSLALIADAGHMLIDSGGLVLALAASVMARRPADARRTFGYARAEVLIVPFHALLMLGLATYLVYQAVQRAGESPRIDGWAPLAVGVAGLAVNLLTLRLLHPHSHGNLNARGAMYEVAADTLGSAGVIASGAVIVLTGWTPIDAIIGLAIGVLVVPRALSLLRPTLGILLESAPSGVVGLHDVHVWTITPAFVLLSAHLEVRSMDDAAEAIAAVTALVRANHGIEHVTLQPETPELHAAINCCEFPDAIPAMVARHDHAARAPLPAER